MPLQIFMSFLRAALIRSLRYRFDFIMSLLEGLSILLINLIFFFVSAEIALPDQQVDLYLLAPVFQIFIGIFYGLFIDNITGLKYYINRGDLDWMLMKPVSSQVYISLRFINFGHIVSGLLAIPVIVKIFSVYGLHANIIELCVACLYVVIAVFDGYALLTTTTSVAIALTTSGNVSSVVLPLLSVGKYPRRVFKEITPLMIVAVPCLLVCDYAKDALLGVWSIEDILLHLAIMSAQLWLTHLVFRKASNKYKSSGS